MKSIAKNSLANIICAMLDPLFSMLTTAYTARILLAAGAGRIAYAQSIVVYFSAFAEFGISSYGIREIAKARSRKKDVNVIFTELMIINFMTTTCALLAYCWSVCSFPDYYVDRNLFLVCGLSIFFNYFNVDWLFRGQEEYVYIAGRNLIVRIISLIAIYLFVQTRDDYIKYALIGSMTGGLIAFFNICRVYKLAGFSFKKLSLKKHLKFLGVFTINNVLNSLYNKAGTTMLGILTTETATGYYSYADYLIRMITNICSAAPAVLYPRLSYSYKNDRDEFDRLLRLGISIVMFIAFPASMGFFILTPQIIEIILGDDFLPAVKTFRILSLQIMILGIADLCFQLLMATGNEKKRALTLGWGLVGNVLLNSVFIPLRADCGAAISCIISELTLNGYLVWKMYRKIRFHIPWKAFRQALVSTAIMGVAVLGVVQFDLNPVVQCAMAVACGIFLYVALNLYMGNELLNSLIRKMNNVW